MKKAIIFGAGLVGKKSYNLFKHEYDFLCFVDNAGYKQGTTLCGLPVYSPARLKEIEFDCIFIAAILNDAGTHMHTQLLSYGVDEAKIHLDFQLLFFRSREICVNRISEIVYEQRLMGQVAEAGMYTGDFAKVINRNFPDKTLHLFDNFNFFNQDEFAKFKYDFLSAAPLPEKCVIHKGNFPDTAKDINETFCFVNIDMSTYQANLDGLVYFYPRLTEQGIILMHDYFCEPEVDVKRTVAAYSSMIGQRLKIVPIGDDYSIAIVK